MNRLIHIAPQLPPAIDGVGDYCKNLWQHWSDPRPDWRFLVMHGASATRRAWPDVTVREFGAGKAPLIEALEQSEGETAVLHYVGYGFQPKGIPLWLPAALREWKRASPQRRLVTMFHEMYARSSPLRSPFWVMPVARRIIREVVQLSDLWITSCERFVAQLTTEFAVDPARGRIIPIGSNIPVLAHRNAVADREVPKVNIVLFGLAKTRLWALERHSNLLRALVATDLVDTITLAGKRVELAADERAWQRLAQQIGTARWERRFDLSAEEVSALLARNHLGLIVNEPDALTKSGVFAALTSHGVVPVVAARPGDALPDALKLVAITNTDVPERVRDILLQLSDPETVRLHRDAAISFSARELAWPRITAHWQEFLMRLGPGATTERKVRHPRGTESCQNGERVVAAIGRCGENITPHHPASSL